MESVLFGSFPIFYRIFNWLGLAGELVGFIFLERVHYDLPYISPFSFFALLFLFFLFFLFSFFFDMSSTNFHVRMKFGDN